MNISRNCMLAAMECRNSHYDGVFFVGVKTMKIYCLPSCKAKLPLPRNVIFFRNEKDALSAHYRPCKRCKPNLFPNVRSTWLDESVDFLRDNTDRRVRACELARIAGVDVSTLRRVFTAAFGKTPAVYHRELRLQQAAYALACSKPVVQVAEETGFESLSGFVDAFRKKFGVSPGRYATR